METIRPKISVIILTKNNGSTVGKVLEQIERQQLYETYEVIIVDSGSTDNTLELISQHDVRLYTIAPNKFGHGKTRNLASGYAKGDYLVYLSADAIPASKEWLENLVKRLDGDDDNVAATFGRQIPYDDTKPMERFFIKKNYPAISSAKERGSANDFSMNTFFSNVNSAIKRSAWEKIKFAETLIISEDHDWARRVHNDGFRIEYAPDAPVFHSHNYGLKQVFKRFFDSGASFSQMGMKPAVVKNGIWYFLDEIRYVMKKNMWLVPYAACYDLSKFVGFFLGIHEKWIPSFVKTHLSMHSYHWK